MLATLKGLFFGSNNKEKKIKKSYEQRQIERLLDTKDAIYQLYAEHEEVFINLRENIKEIKTDRVNGSAYFRILESKINDFNYREKDLRTNIDFAVKRIPVIDDSLDRDHFLEALQGPIVFGSSVRNECRRSWIALKEIVKVLNDYIEFTKEKTDKDISDLEGVVSELKEEVIPKLAKIGDM